MHYRKIGNRWYFSVTVTLQDGTRKRIERVGGNTKPEARRAAQEFLKQTDKFGRLYTPTEITFQEYTNLWLEKYVQVNLADNTIDSYRNAIKLLNESFGDKKLYKITPVMLQDYVKTMGEKYTYNTILQRISILKKIFNDAIEPYEFIEKNPAKLLKPPMRTLEPDADEVKVFSEDEIKQIFQHFRSDNIHFIPIILAFHTGMRKGECLGLCWQDIDFKNNLIHVCRNQYDKKGSPIVYKRTKSKKYRTIDMGTTLLEILAAHKQQQIENRQQYGKAYQESDYVCTHPDGSKITSDDLRYFNMWCKKQGMSGSFHSLRHTHATMLIEAGMDLDYVSKRLGHSNIMITSRTYLHITRKRRDKAISLIDKIL